MGTTLHWELFFELNEQMRFSDICFIWPENLISTNVHEGKPCLGFIPAVFLGEFYISRNVLKEGLLPNSKVKVTKWCFEWLQDLKVDYFLEISLHTFTRLLILGT